MIEENRDRYVNYASLYGESEVKWILMNIGCIECGISSQIIGVFSDQKEAQKLASILKDKGYWEKGGKNHYEVFSLDSGFWVKGEYLELAYKEE